MEHSWGQAVTGWRDPRSPLRAHHFSTSASRGSLCQQRRLRMLALSGPGPGSGCLQLLSVIIWGRRCSWKNRQPEPCPCCVRILADESRLWQQLRVCRACCHRQSRLLGFRVKPAASSSHRLLGTDQPCTRASRRPLSYVLATKTCPHKQ